MLPLLPVPTLCIREVASCGYFRPPSRFVRDRPSKLKALNGNEKLGNIVSTGSIALEVITAKKGGTNGVLFVPGGQ
jgi:hypothetical protein